MFFQNNIIFESFFEFLPKIYLPPVIQLECSKKGGKTFELVEEMDKQTHWKDRKTDRKKERKKEANKRTNTNTLERQKDRKKLLVGFDLLKMVDK